MGAYALEPTEVGDATFSIVVPVFNTPPKLLRATVDSVLAQSYSRWELLLVDDASMSKETKRSLKDQVARDERIHLHQRAENGGMAAATNSGAESAHGDYLLFLDHDDVLLPHALAWLSTCTPEADLIYADEARLTRDGVSHLRFKPAWSPRLLLDNNYINHPTVVRRSTFEEVGGLRIGMDGVQDHDFLIRLSELPLTVAHVPNILYLWRRWEDMASESASGRTTIEQRGLEMIRDTIERRGWRAHASLGSGSPFRYRVIFDPDPEPPLVKIVMPTRDHPDLLRTAVDGVLTRTDGVSTHLVIVDNGSRDPEAITFLTEIAQRDDVTVHTIDDGFNFSRLCNEGTEQGPEAPLLLFLNNDVEIRHRRWLLQLTGWLRDPQVSGAGPLLLYPSGRIQHAGVVVGTGRVAQHYAYGRKYAPQTNGLYDQAREVSCLTAACLLVRADQFAEVGGMREELPNDFQDVDLCLRLRSRLGGELVYDPTFPVVHAESESRTAADRPVGYSTGRMRFLWGPELAKTDEFYSPHLHRNASFLRRETIPRASGDRYKRISPRFRSTDPT